MKINEILKEWKDYSPASGDIDNKTYKELMLNNPWTGEIVGQNNLTDFEVKLSNKLTQQELHFVLRPIGMINDGGAVYPDNFDVADLQTGRYDHWSSGYGMPLHQLAAWDLFYDDETPGIGKKMADILQHYVELGKKGKNAPRMPGINAFKSIGTKVSVDQFLKNKNLQDKVVKQVGSEKEKPPGEDPKTQN